jgi:serine protease Do
MKRQQKTILTKRFVATSGIFFYSLLFCLQAAEIEKLPRSLRANGVETLSAIRNTLEDRLKATTVAILDKDEVVALGTIVREKGLIVTKASELGWQTSVRLPNGEELVPESVMVDDSNDLAVLRMNQSFYGLLTRDRNSEASRGQILVSPATEKMRIKIGIVGADQRSVKRVGGALGVGLGNHGLPIGGVEVSEVFDDTAAEKGGVIKGDVISAVNKTVVLLRSQLIEAIAAHRPGENVVVKLHRGDDILELNIVLGYRSTYFGRLEDRNQRLSGKTSTRLSGFESILQHDIPVEVDAMGGPVVDLQGNLVGVNIAKADRVSTYAIPVSLIDRILQEFGAEYAQEEGE